MSNQKVVYVNRRKKTYSSPNIIEVSIIFQTGLCSSSDYGGGNGQNAILNPDEWEV